MSIKNISYQEKEKLFNLISEILEKATNDSDGVKIDRIEKGLTRFIVLEWDKRSTKALNQVDSFLGNSKAPFTKKDGERVSDLVENAYKDIAPAVLKRTQKDFLEIYKISKKKFASEFKPGKNKSTIFMSHRLDPFNKDIVPFNYFVQSLKTPLEKIIAEFSEADFLIVDNLTRLHNVAIGDHYPKTLKPGVTKAIKIGVERGMNKAQASEFLQKELGKKLGGKAAATPSKISAQGIKSTNAYFKGLQSTNVTMARSFSQIQLLKEAGVSRYQWNSIIDNLTSQICSEMDGRVFEVQQAEKQMEKILGADDVESLKGIAPFTRDLTALGLKQGQKLDDKGSREALEKAGILFPPVHFRCRSTINPF